MLLRKLLNPRSYNSITQEFTMSKENPVINHRVPMFLTISISDVEEVKYLGARWHNYTQKWYIPNKHDYPKFQKWILNNNKSTIICDHIYIVEAIRRCYKCKKETKVIGFGIENYFNFFPSAYEYQENTIHIVPYIDLQGLLPYIKENYNYRYRYSRTQQEYCWANGCQHCDALQGNFYLFDEDDSPFHVSTDKEAMKLNFYKFHLEQDVVSDSFEIYYPNQDYLFKEHSKIIDTNIWI